MPLIERDAEVSDIFEVIDELRNVIEQREIEREIERSRRRLNWRKVARWACAVGAAVAVLVLILVLIGIFTRPLSGIVLFLENGRPEAHKAA